MEKQSRETSPIAKRLQMFIGEWHVAISGISFRADKSEIVTGRITFEWLEGGAFMLKRSAFSDADFPAGTELIGLDEQASSTACSIRTHAVCCGFIT